tara:strand:- start:4085 stop:4855 length:771 start_codon:yes stop_codon:yes gene_type:complete
MLTFLRKIRKSLIDSGSTRKYFVYAVGEIALVVIGILIALNINNWNQDRINNEKQIEYLQNIVNDIDLHISNLEYHLKEENSNLEEMEKLISHFHENEGFLLNDTTLQYFGSVFDRTTFLATRPTYVQLLSSGNIGLIRNDSLRNEIVSYYQKLERRELIVLKNNDVKDFVINPIFIKNIDLTFESTLKVSTGLEENLPSQLEQTNKNLLEKDRIFEVVNIIKLKFLATYSVIEWFEEDMQGALKMKRLINSELRN